MEKSEGKAKYIVKLTEFDIKIMLEALGTHQHVLQNRRMSGKATDNLIQKIYRSMGVRL